MSKRIIYIDASSLKSDSICDRRFLLHIIRGYSQGVRAANYKAGYGTAFHAFLENYYSVPPADRLTQWTRLTNIGMEAYKKYEPHIDWTSKFEFRTPDHLHKVMAMYSGRYRLGDSLVPLTFKMPAPEGVIPDTSSLLEKKFCVPWYEDETLIIYLTGTIDMICDYHGRVIIVDHKSTSTQQAYIGRFFEEFRMSIQGQLYVKIFRQLSGMSEYVPLLINGIFVKKPTKASEEKGIFDGVHFQRSSLIEYTEEQMNQFDEYLQRTLNHILGAIKVYGLKELLEDVADLGPTNYAACHGRFSSCPFYEMCALPPKEQILYLKSRYNSETYNPLCFND